jgi:hypothetical protein
MNKVFSESNIQRSRLVTRNYLLVTRDYLRILLSFI